MDVGNRHRRAEEPNCSEDDRTMKSGGTIPKGGRQGSKGHSRLVIASQKGSEGRTRKEIKAAGYIGNERIRGRLVNKEIWKSERKIKSQERDEQRCKDKGAN